jgi:hypothetical protein
MPADIVQLAIDIDPESPYNLANINRVVLHIHAVPILGKKVYPSTNWKPISMPFFPPTG